MENPNTWTYFYYVSCMIIAAAAVIGIWQLFIMKHDIKTRYKRATMENSIKLIDRYYDKGAKISDEVYAKEKSENMPEYNKHRQFESLPAIDDDLLLKRAIISLKTGFPKLANELDTFAVGVLSGLCDEEYVFKTVGRSFCYDVARYYDILKSYNEIMTGHDCTLELFDIWRKRIIKDKLKFEKEKLSDKQREIIDKMQKLMDKKIPSIK